MRGSVLLSMIDSVVREFNNVFGESNWGANWDKSIIFSGYLKFGMQVLVVDSVTKNPAFADGYKLVV